MERDDHPVGLSISDVLEAILRIPTWRQYPADYAVRAACERIPRTVQRCCAA
jgi:hypothetical protein